MKETKNKNILMTVGAVLLFVISLALISISYKPGTEDGELISSYNASNMVNYKVYIDKNEFFENEYLGMNQRYITSIINKVNTSFNHSFSASENVDLNYTYKVTGKINAYYDNENENTSVWSKSYVLVEPTSKTNVGSKYSINKVLDIDYQKYDEIIKNFKLKMGLPVNATLTVTMDINTTGRIKDSDKTINETNKIVLDIPLDKVTTQFKTDYNKNYTKTVVNNITSNLKINYASLIPGIIVLLLAVALLYKVIMNYRREYKKSELEIKLKRILKNYAEIIAETDRIPDMSNYSIIDIKLFRDMLDIQAELHIPILFYKSPTEVGGVFIIFYENKAYRYFIRQDTDIKTID